MLRQVCFLWLPHGKVLNRHLQQASSSNVIFFLESNEEDTGFQDLALQPIYIWWENIFSIFMAVSSNILWQNVLDFLPSNLLNICQACQNCRRWSHLSLGQLSHNHYALSTVKTLKIRSNVNRNILPWHILISLSLCFILTILFILLYSYYCTQQKMK